MAFAGRGSFRSFLPASKGKLQIRSILSRTRTPPKKDGQAGCQIFQIFKDSQYDLERIHRNRASEYDPRHGTTLLLVVVNRLAVQTGLNPHPVTMGYFNTT
jgi:hypothetical protein